MRAEEVAMAKADSHYTTREARTFLVSHVSDPSMEYVLPKDVIPLLRAAGIRHKKIGTSYLWDVEMVDRLVFELKRLKEFPDA